MIVEPDRYIVDFKNVGANILTVHIEASKHLHRTLQAIKQEGMKAGVDNIVMSMEDITNKSDIKSIVRTKLNREDAEKAAMGVKKDIKKVEQKGLMAKPKKEETA